jgi:hypothetical protein
MAKALVRVDDLSRRPSPGCKIKINPTHHWKSKEATAVQINKFPGESVLPGFAMVTMHTLIVHFLRSREELPTI